MKMLLIGQSVMPEKYERTPGSWREKARALESGIWNQGNS